MSIQNRSEHVIQELQRMVKEAEGFLKSADLPSGDDFKEAKKRFENTINNAKDEIIRIEKVLIEKTKDAVKTTDNYVKDNPWQAVGIGAAIGLVLGIVISKK